MMQSREGPAGANRTKRASGWPRSKLRSDIGILGKQGCLRNANIPRGQAQPRMENNFRCSDYYFWSLNHINSLLLQMVGSQGDLQEPKGCFPAQRKCSLPRLCRPVSRPSLPRLLCISYRYAGTQCPKYFSKENPSLAHMQEVNCHLRVGFQAIPGIPFILDSVAKSGVRRGTRARNIQKLPWTSPSWLSWPGSGIVREAELLLS